MNNIEQANRDKLVLLSFNDKMVYNSRGIQTERIDFIKHLISYKDPQDEHYQTALHLSKDEQQDSFQGKAFHYVMITNNQNDSVTDIGAKAINKVVITKLKHYKLKQVETDISNESLASLFQCTFHKNCDFYIKIRYLGTLFQKEIPIQQCIEWNPQEKRLCCIVISRSGEHIQEQNKSFFEIINEKDNLLQNYGLAGPFSENQMIQNKEPFGFKINVDDNTYYIQTIQENFFMTFLIKYFYKYTISSAYELFKQDLLDGFFNFINQIKEKNDEQSIELFFFHTQSLELLYNADLSKLDNFIDIQERRINPEQIFSLRKHNINGTNSRFGQPKDFQLIHWDCYLIEDFLLNFLTPMLKWLKILSLDQIKQIAFAQFNALNQDKSLFKFTQSERQFVQKQVNNAVGGYLKEQFNQIKNDCTMDIYETSKNFKELYFDQGLSTDQIETGYLKHQQMFQINKKMFKIKF